MEQTDLTEFTRAQLGRQAALVGSERKALARALEPGEQPRCVAMGMRGPHGFLVLLTDRRLLLARGWSPIPRRDRVETWPLAELAGATRHALSLHADFGARGALQVGLAPEGPAHALTDALRIGLGFPDPVPARAELRELAQRKLGARLTSDLRADLAFLADGLLPDEDVQRLAFAGDSHGPLLAALSASRLLLVHAALRAAKDRWLEWSREHLRVVARTGDVLQLEDGGEPLPPIVFTDAARCDEFEAVLR